MDSCVHFYVYLFTLRHWERKRAPGERGVRLKAGCHCPLSGRDQKLSLSLMVLSLTWTSKLSSRSCGLCSQHLWQPGAPPHPLHHLPQVTTLPLAFMRVSHFSHVQLFVTPWTGAHQAPLSVGFSRQKHCSGFHALQGIFSSNHVSHVSYIGR